MVFVSMNSKKCKIEEVNQDNKEKYKSFYPSNEWIYIGIVG